MVHHLIIEPYYLYLTLGLQLCKLLQPKNNKCDLSRESYKWVLRDFSVLNLILVYGFHIRACYIMVILT